MPVKAHMLKVLMFYQHREELYRIRWTRPETIWSISFRATTQVLQYRGEHPRRLFERPTHFGQRHKMGWLRRLDQLPPQIHLTRPTMEALPVVAACPHHFAGILVDEAMT